MFPDPPIVTLKMGANLNANDLKENDDVYFECHIRANPKYQKITWFHDVRRLALVFIET